MIHHVWLCRFRRATAGALFAAALALVSACGSKDNRPLVVVAAPQLAPYAGAGATVRITVKLDNGPSTEKSVALGQVASGNIGIYLPSGASGSGTVVVAVLDGSGCVVASGSSPVAVKAGEISTPVTINLAPTGLCTPDAGVPPILDAGAIDAGAADGPSADVPGREVTGAGDTSLPVVDGPPVSTDAQPAGVDTLGVDLAVPLDSRVDATVSTPDVPLDIASPDVVVTPDLGPDGPADASPTVTTMNVLANCTAYTHTKKTSTGAPETWGVRQLAFSPDGKNMVSFGEDGRAKVWNVTPTGLAEPSSGLVFTGSGDLSGTISPDGKYLAVGDYDSQVSVYDFAASIQFGAQAKKWSLPSNALSPLPYSANRLQFTTDGGHLVVLYSGDSGPPATPNHFVVWDLGTQKVARLVDYDYADWPMAILPGDYTGPMWVASAASIYGDAGDYVSTVTLMDVSQASPTKAQITLPGYVERMAFSPDGTTLAISFDSGEVSLWDITSKSNIVRMGSPLIPGTFSYYEAYALAYTPDGKYLAAGIFDGTVRLAQIQQKVSLQKSVDYYPWSLAFTPDGLGLAVGEGGGYCPGTILYCRP